MSYKESKTEIFDLLKSNMSNYSEALRVDIDSEDQYFLNTLKVGKNKKPIFFGAIKINKNYVSYHLMPIYINPSLLDSISDDLKERMQGKSCFNFKEVNKPLFKELKALTTASYDFYEKEGYL